MGRKHHKKHRRKLRVIERKLKRESAYGQCIWSDNLIEIDPRQKPRQYLNTLVHELLHYVFPDLAESRVREAAGTITRRVWEAGYRKLAK